MQIEITNSMEASYPTNPSSTSQYWNLFKHMSDGAKLDLIVMLTQSLRHKDKPIVSANDYYGIWTEDGISADEAVSELKSLRSFKRQPLQL